uniref:Uncharacterized protein n=1 Tax=Arundo donax TaxID=35708 RepID=A0A0A9D0I2_ARUDO
MPTRHSHAPLSPFAAPTLRHAIDLDLKRQAPAALDQQRVALSAALDQELAVLLHVCEPEMLVAKNWFECGRVQ